MISRASGALLFTYLLLSAAGFFFLLIPPPTVELIASGVTAVLFGLFYIVGGIVAAVSLVARRFVKSSGPLWYFEVGGISLLIVANISYSYTLSNSAIQLGHYYSLAAALVVLAFSGGLAARAIETLRLVRALKLFSRGDAENE